MQKKARKNKMKIVINRSGGFANISMPAKVVETDDKEIKELVRQAVSASTDDSDEHPVVDGFIYDISIEEDGKMHTIKARDGDSNLNVQKLIDRCLDR